MFSIDNIIDSYFPALNQNYSFTSRHIVSFLHNSCPRKTGDHIAVRRQRLQTGFPQVKAHARRNGFSVTALYKQYTELCEPGEVFFRDFNTDSKFTDCVDGFVVVDTAMVKAARRKRYIGTEAADTDRIAV